LVVGRTDVVPLKPLKPLIGRVLDDRHTKTPPPDSKLLINNSGLEVTQPRAVCTESSVDGCHISEAGTTTWSVADLVAKETDLEAIWQSMLSAFMAVQPPLQ